MEKEKSTVNILVEKRFYFILEFLIVAIGGFVLIIIANILTDFFIDESSDLYGPFYFLTKAIAILIAIPILLHLTFMLLKSQNKETGSNIQISPSKGYLKLYKITFSNFKYQLLFGLLILFIVFIPLDFFTYLMIPQMIEYQAKTLSASPTGYYFSKSYPIFLLSAIIIHVSVALIEESIARGLIAKRGSEHYNKMSAVIISSLYFGLGHLAYFFFNPISASYSIWFSFTWFAQAFFIGIILSMIILKKKWLFPLIFAHALNNIISAHAIWNYQQGNDFIAVTTLYIYFPLLIGSIILLVWQFSRIKTAISVGFKEFISYFTQDSERMENKRDVLIRILIDGFMGLMIFIIGFLIM